MRSLLHTFCALACAIFAFHFLASCDGPSSPSRIDTDRDDTDTFVNSLGMGFVRIPAGTFQMGSSNGQADEQPVHEVTISQDFYLSKFEVTQGWWETLMGDNPSRFRDPWRPVENVSWADVQDFIQKLNEREDGAHYRLPTEAEWEYAVRAGSRTTYHFGDAPNQLRKYAWYSVNAEGRTWPAARKRSNPHGLHDVYGNVWEWVHDAYDPDYYATSPSVDPRADDVRASARVIRGGGWHSVTSDMRSANRGWARPGVRFDHVGFRLVREIPEE